jgi:hypothetical protein
MQFVCVSEGEEDMVYRLILASIMVLGFSLPAGADKSENECALRFNACANACAALESDANDGCLGRCLLDNGCEINDDKSAGNGTPRGKLPDEALPRSSLPGDRLPTSHLPDSRM